ncbi:F-box/LRR-repeat protein 3-like [Lathyrus oleraceus]|uniref:F-box/LRR-repeat protein 3-like n=1 Tax=Pisum sativum TaxID=3888 RepID=UPI0021D017D8|nr:F-box/LRR-repeat protein 3-like [Pisum sativum]
MKSKNKKISFHKSLFLITMMKMKRTCLKSMKKKKRRTCLKSSQQQPLSSTNSIIIPDDCWEHVFTFIINPAVQPDLKFILQDAKTEEKNKLNFKSLSLVSKQFLSITNRIIFSRRIYYPHLCYLPRFFHRFSNLNFLHLSFISESGDLDCSHDLDHAAIALALRDRPTLKSLNISWIELIDANYITSHYIDSFASLKSLNSLQFRCSRISDDLLYSIAREGLPLKTFVLQDCNGYSYHGIYALLSKCHEIQHLVLQDVDFLTNHQFSQLSLLIPNLVSINLSDCFKLTESALFALIKNCHSLAEITMENIYIDRESLEKSNTFKDFDVNPQLKFLYLAHNSFINDDIIISFASIFPNLQLLDLSYCCDISEKSICQVLSKCCKIRYLNLTNCKEVRQLTMNFVVHQLEVLNLSGTRVNDKTLYEISNTCGGLLKLLLIRCKYVTEKGVMRVVEKCRQLEEIYLRGCDKVNADAMKISMLSSNPSLENDDCSDFAELRLKF